MTNKQRRRILRRAARTLPHVHYERVVGFKWKVYTRENKRRAKWVLRETINGKTSESIFEYVRARYPNHFINNDSYEKVIIVGGLRKRGLFSKW